MAQKRSHSSGQSNPPVSVLGAEESDEDLPARARIAAAGSPAPPPPASARSASSDAAADRRPSRSSGAPQSEKERKYAPVKHLRPSSRGKDGAGGRPPNPPPESSPAARPLNLPINPSTGAPLGARPFAGSNLLPASAELLCVADIKSAGGLPVDYESTDNSPLTRSEAGSFIDDQNADADFRPAAQPSATSSSAALSSSSLTATLVSASPQPQRSSSRRSSASTSSSGSAASAAAAAVRAGRQSDPSGSGVDSAAALIRELRTTVACTRHDLSSLVSEVQSLLDVLSTASEGDTWSARQVELVRALQDGLPGHRRTSQELALSPESMSALGPMVAGFIRQGVAEFGDVVRAEQKEAAATGAFRLPDEADGLRVMLHRRSATKARVLLDALISALATHRGNHQPRSSASVPRAEQRVVHLLKSAAFAQSRKNAGAVQELALCVRTLGAPEAVLEQLHRLGVCCSLTTLRELSQAGFHARADELVRGFVAQSSVPAVRAAGGGQAGDSAARPAQDIALLGDELTVTRFSRAEMKTNFRLLYVSALLHLPAQAVAVDAGLLQRVGLAWPTGQLALEAEAARVETMTDVITWFFANSMGGLRRQRPGEPSVADQLLHTVPLQRRAAGRATLSSAVAIVASVRHLHSAAPAAHPPAAASSAASSSPSSSRSASGHEWDEEEEEEETFVRTEVRLTHSVFPHLVAATNLVAGIAHPSTPLDVARSPLLQLPKLYTEGTANVLRGTRGFDVVTLSVENIRTANVAQTVRCVALSVAGGPPEVMQHCAKYLVKMPCDQQVFAQMHAVVQLVNNPALSAFAGMSDFNAEAEKADLVATKEAAAELGRLVEVTEEQALLEVGLLARARRLQLRIDTDSLRPVLTRLVPLIGVFHATIVVGLQTIYSRLPVVFQMVYDFVYPNRTRNELSANDPPPKVLLRLAVLLTVAAARRSPAQNEFLVVNRNHPTVAAFNHLLDELALRVLFIRLGVQQCKDGAAYVDTMLRLMISSWSYGQQHYGVATFSTVLNLLALSRDDELWSSFSAGVADLSEESVELINCVYRHAVDRDGDTTLPPEATPLGPGTDSDASGPSSANLYNRRAKETAVFVFDKAGLINTTCAATPTSAPKKVGAGSNVTAKDDKIQKQIIDAQRAFDSLLNDIQEEVAVSASLSFLPSSDQSAAGGGGAKASLRSAATPKACTKQTLAQRTGLAADKVGALAAHLVGKGPYTVGDVPSYLLAPVVFWLLTGDDRVVVPGSSPPEVPQGADEYYKKNATMVHAESFLHRAAEAGAGRAAEPKLLPVADLRQQLGVVLAVVGKTVAELHLPTSDEWNARLTSGKPKEKWTKWQLLYAVWLFSPKVRAKGKVGLRDQLARIRAGGGKILDADRPVFRWLSTTLGELDHTSWPVSWRAAPNSHAPDADGVFHVCHAASCKDARAETPTVGLGCGCSFHLTCLPAVEPATIAEVVLRAWLAYLPPGDAVEQQDLDDACESVTGWCPACLAVVLADMRKAEGAERERTRALIESWYQGSGAEITSRKPSLK